jgi:hypothetical protein
MGSSGWAIRLEPIEGQTPSWWVEVREATMQFLWDVWRSALPRPMFKVAWQWVSWGEDSLLTLGERDQPREEPVDRIIFWFYLSVDWPSELADHWLHMALASDRPRFERLMGELGYRIADSTKYPELSNNRYRFAVVGKRIGRPSQEGIYWAFPTHVWQDIAACTPIEQQRGAAVVEGGACQCPLCVKLGFSAAPEPGAKK